MNCVQFTPPDSPRSNVQFNQAGTNTTIEHDEEYFSEAALDKNQEAQDEFIKLLGKKSICREAAEMIWTEWKYSPSAFLIAVIQPPYELDDKLCEIASVIVTGMARRSTEVDERVKPLVKWLADILLPLIDDNNVDALKLFAEHVDAYLNYLNQIDLGPYLKKAADKLNHTECAYEYALHICKPNTLSQNQDYHKYLKQAAEHGHPHAQRDVLDIRKNFPALIDDKLFINCSYECALRALKANFDKAFSLIQNLFDNAPSDAIKGQAAYMMSQMIEYINEQLIKYNKSEKLPEGYLNNEEILKQYRQKAGELGYDAAIWEDASLTGNLEATLQLAALLLTDPVLSKMPNSGPKADRIIQQALKKIGVTSTNVQAWWSYFKHHPQQLNTSVIKKIVKAEALSFDDIVLFLRELIDKPTSLYGKLEPYLLKKLLVKVLIFGANKNIPGAAQMLKDDRELRSILFSKKPAYSTRDVLTCIVEKCGFDYDSLDKHEQETYRECQYQLGIEAEATDYNKEKAAIYFYQAAAKGNYDAKEKVKDLIEKSSLTHITPAIWPHAIAYYKATLQQDISLVTFFQFLYFAVTSKIPEALKEFSDLISIFSTRTLESNFSRNIEIADFDKTSWNMRSRQNWAYLKDAADTYKNPIVERLYAQASSDVEYYKRAAAQGDIQAQIDLGKKGVPGYAYRVAIQAAFGNKEQGITLYSAANVERYLAECQYKCKDTENDPRIVWLLAKLYARLNMQDRADRYSKKALELGHPIAIFENEIKEQLPLAEQGDAIAKNKVTQALRELHKFSNYEQWSFPGSYEEKTKQYADLAKRFNLEKDDEDHFTNEDLPKEYLSKAVSKVLTMTLEESESNTKKATTEEIKEFKTNALYQILTTTFPTEPSSEESNEESENEINIESDNLNLIKSQLKDHPDLMLSVLQKAVDKNFPNALKMLVETLIERYQNEIPLEWKPYIEAAAEKLDHTAAQIALTHLKDYTYACSLAKNCMNNPTELTPAKDTTKYLSFAANLHGNEEAAELLTQIYESFDNPDYKKYFIEGLSAEQAEQIAGIYRAKVSSKK